MGRLVKTGPAAANFDAVWSAGARGAGFHRQFGVFLGLPPRAVGAGEARGGLPPEK